jgi:RimJ/RimL family protein N-acetyltransferase
LSPSGDRETAVSGDVRGCHSEGLSKIFTYIRTDNPAALATYQHHGFTIVGVTPKRTRGQDRYIDEYVVERMLTTDETEHALSLR